MVSYIRLLAFTIVSSLAYPLAVSAQNSSDLRSLTIPASACEINTSGGSGTEFTGGAAGGRQGHAALFVEAPLPEGTAVAVAFCPVPLSNVRVAGSGSPRLAKFRVYYSDSDAAGTASRVLVEFGETFILGTNITGGGVGCRIDSNTIGNTKNTATTSTAICSVPYTFKAKVFYNMHVTLLANPGGYTQFFGIDFP